MQNILFYKYVSLNRLPELKEELLSFCKQHHLKGKILIADEGINGCLSGEERACNSFQQYFRQKKEFADILFKYTPTQEHTFKRTLVKIRNEIITFKESVDIKNAGSYIEPQQLKTMLDNHEEVVLLDARNTYESNVGKFADAIVPSIKEFSEWPQAVKKLEHLKDKKIITYCTGGIRCEKASAYLKEQGFTDVHQLHGGILSYGNQVNDVHWEGLCVVFDKRGAIEIASEKDREVLLCNRCMTPEETERTCKVCNSQFLGCDKCFVARQQCCSKMCFNIQRNA